MLGGALRLLGRWTRSLEAGSPGRRWPATARLRNLNADVVSQGRTVSERASHYANNNAHARAALTALTSNIIGPGITPSPQHPDPAVRARLAALWSAWTDVADADRAMDFYGLQALAVRGMVQDGESFCLLSDGPPSDARSDLPPLRLKLIHPSQCPRDWPAGLNSNLVRAGIEHDAAGRRIAYLMLPVRPDDPFQALVTLALTPVRIPAADTIHLFECLEPGQLRGLSWFSPVLLALRELDALYDAALVRAKVSNLLCAVTQDPDGSGAAGLGLPGEQGETQFDASLEPGSIVPLPPGRSVEFLDPKESAHFGAFARNHLQAIAAGLGIPYELLTGDLSQVNYSSIRAGLVEFRKRLEHWQHNIVVFRFCRPIWDRFIESAVLAGLIDPVAYAADRAGYHAVTWIPPRQEWVDPKKDAEAEILAIEAGLTSRTACLRSRGLDPDQVRLEISHERQADQAAGLTFTMPKIGTGQPVDQGAQTSAA